MMNRSSSCNATSSHSPDVGRGCPQLYLWPAMGSLDKCQVRRLDSQLKDDRSRASRYLANSSSRCNDYSKGRAVDHPLCSAYRHQRDRIARQSASLLR